MSKPITQVKGGAFASNTITVSQFSNELNNAISGGVATLPKISYISYPNGANANNTGGETITFIGSNFNANISLILNATRASPDGTLTIPAANITRTNTSHMTFVSPVLAVGTYSIYAINTDGGRTKFLPGLIVEQEPSNHQLAGTVSGYTTSSPSSPTFSGIEKFSLATNQNATNIGTLSQGRYIAAGASSTTHGYTAGGQTPGVTPSAFRNTIDRFPFATNQGATNIGTLSLARAQGAGASSTTHGYVAGGYNGPPVPTGFRLNIDRYPFATNQSATNVAQIAPGAGTFGSAGHSSETHGYKSGGGNGPGFAAVIANLERFPFATNQNSTNVAQLATGRVYSGSSCAPTHGYVAGGMNPYLPVQTRLNTIERFPFATNQNGVSVSNISGSALRAGMCSVGQQSASHGYFCGGNGPPNAPVTNIEKVPFATNVTTTNSAALASAQSYSSGQVD